MLVTKERDGLRTNDEGFKMATTDALSVAMKMLGVAADIYAGRGTARSTRRRRWRLRFRCRADSARRRSPSTTTPLALLERSVAEVNAKAEAQVTNSFITEAQRKRPFGIFRQSGHTKEQVSAWLASGGIESSKQITQNEYEAICERLADPRPLL